MDDDGFVKLEDIYRYKQLGMDENNKVCAMTKIWNAPWALGELGWT